MLKKRVSENILTGTTGGTGTGTARTSIGLGAAYGRVIAVEIKGDDANVDVNNTLALTDAEGRLVLKAIAFDAGTDDSTLKKTSQTEVVGAAASTVGVKFALVIDEDSAWQSSAGALTTDNVGATAGLGVPCKSPIQVDIAAGTDGDYHKVILWVEV